jgi:hypothetical protein
MDIHHLSSENGRRSLDIDQVPHILEFSDCLFILRIIVQGIQRLIDISADLIGRSIVSDDSE